jgi:hypothetical protein
LFNLPEEKLNNCEYVEKVPYLCNVIHKIKIRMTTKNTNNLPIVKKSLGGLKKLLAEDLKSERHKIRFKRYGSKYIITNKDSDLSSKLEKSFNSFMDKLSVNPDGKKLRGICFIDKNSDDFSVGYQREGEYVLHQIKGRLG